LKTKIFSTALKNDIAVHMYNGSVVVVNSGANPTIFEFTATTPAL
jgi:hypothetical protein